MRVTESVHKLHIMVNKNYMQYVGLVSSALSTEEKSRLIGSHVWLHFPWFSQNELIWSEGLLPTMENDVMRQIQAFFSKKGLPSSSCPDSHPLTTETVIFVKSHVKSDCSHLQEACYKLVSCAASLVVQDTSLQSLWAAAPRAAARHAFHVWVGEF
jgi:hypothetical protein